MNSTFRFALVGSGMISNTYVKAISRLRGMSLVAVVSRNGHRPTALESPVPVVPSLAAVPVPFDAAILATPNGMHHEDAIVAASLGKHVLTEKPLDITIPAMDAMTEACADAGVKLGVTFQRRMSPDNMAVKACLDRGDFGRLFAADLSVKFYRDQAYYDSAPYRGNRSLDGGGPFIQQAAHNIDILCWFFGMPETVVSMLDTFAHAMEGEDHGAALLRYPDGMIGTIIASTIAKPGFPARLALHAEAGSVVLENDVITTWELDGMPNPSKADGFAVHDGSGSAAVAETAGHEAVVADFVQAVRNDREPAVAPASARLATELILRIYGNDMNAAGDTAPRPSSTS